jgi:hypothetical protein
MLFQNFRKREGFKRDSQHNDTKTPHSAVQYAKCLYVECHFIQCYAEYRGAIYSMTQAINYQSVSFIFSEVHGTLNN